MATIEEVRQIKNKIESSLLNLEGVTGVSIRSKKIEGTDREPVIIVYVKNKKDALERNIVPKETEGITIELEERHFIPH